MLLLMQVATATAGRMACAPVGTIHPLREYRSRPTNAGTGAKRKSTESVPYSCNTAFCVDITRYTDLHAGAKPYTIESITQSVTA